MVYSVCFVYCVKHCDECDLCGVYSTKCGRFALVDVCVLYMMCAVCASVVYVWYNFSHNLVFVFGQWFLY